MASVNKIILVGNCGRDPEIRYMGDGKAVANISLATTSRRKDRNTGETIEDTQWHRVTFYERLAEICAEYVKKGKPIYVEGRIKYGKYTDQSGVEKNTVDIIATELQLLGGRDDQQQGQQAPQGQQAAAQRQAPQRQQQPQPQRNAYADARNGGAIPPQPARQAPPPNNGGFEDMDSDVPW